MRLPKGKSHTTASTRPLLRGILQASHCKIVCGNEKTLQLTIWIYTHLCQTIYNWSTWKASLKLKNHLSIMFEYNKYFPYQFEEQKFLTCGRQRKPYSYCLAFFYSTKDHSLGHLCSHFQISNIYCRYNFSAITKAGSWWKNTKLQLKQCCSFYLWNFICQTWNTFFKLCYD